MSQTIETPYLRDIRVARSEGRQEGRQEGIANERNLLRRLAAERFGVEVADRFAVLINRINDPGLLEDIGKLIVNCRTGDELLRRAGGPAK